MPVIRASEVIIGNNSPEIPKLGHAVPKDRLLDDTELNAVTGGSGVNHSEFSIVKLCDAATPSCFECFDDSAGSAPDSAGAILRGSARL